MTIVKEVKVKKKILNFQEPFMIAYEYIEKTPVLIVIIKDQKGRIGLGSAAPDETITGENIDDLKNIMEKLLCPSLFSQPVSNREWYEKKFQKLFAGYPSAQAAAETAVIHLSSLQEKQNPQNYFGSHREACQLVVTVGIKQLAETLTEVAERLAEGCQAIKLKVGLAVQEDIEKIQAVRELMPKHSQLIIDANQGYSYQDAKRLMKATHNLDIAALEQPIAANRKEEFRKLRNLQLVPLIADESAKTKEEAIKFLKYDYTDGINVKMMKYGGPSTCREIIEYALDRSKLVMLGCMYESNISITAAAYLAMAYPIHFVDLDSGHFDFADDSTSGGALVKKGILRIVGIPKLKNQQTNKA